MKNKIKELNKQLEIINCCNNMQSLILQKLGFYIKKIIMKKIQI